MTKDDWDDPPWEEDPPLWWKGIPILVLVIIVVAQVLFR